MALKRKQSVNLLRLSVSSLEGLTPEDVRELEGLGHGSIGKVMASIDQHNGDLSEISTEAIVLDKDQADRIAKAVLAHPMVPKSWKDSWEAPATVSETPADAARNGSSKENAISAFFRKYW